MNEFHRSYSLPVRPMHIIYPQHAAAFFGDPPAFSTSVEKITLCFVEVSSLFSVPLMQQTEGANTGGDKNSVGRGNRWVGDAEVNIQTKVRR